MSLQLCPLLGLSILFWQWDKWKKMETELCEIPVGLFEDWLCSLASHFVYILCLILSSNYRLTPMMWHMPVCLPGYHMVTVTEALFSPSKGLLTDTSLRHPNESPFVPLNFFLQAVREMHHHIFSLSSLTCKVLRVKIKTLTWFQHVCPGCSCDISVCAEMRFRCRLQCSVWMLQSPVCCTRRMRTPSTDKQIIHSTLLVEWMSQIYVVETPLKHFA